jgi:phage-related protein
MRHRRTVGFTTTWQWSTAERQQIKSACAWQYRRVYCGSTGLMMFDMSDQPTNSVAHDVCAGE